MTCRNKLAQRSPGCAKCIELVRCKTVRIVCATKIVEFGAERIDYFLVDRRVNSRADANVACVIAKLPCIWRRDHDITTNKLAPMHVISKRSGQQPNAIAALLKNLVSSLERGHAGPFQIARVDADAPFLDKDFEPVIQPTHHDRTHWTHRGNIFSLRLAPPKAALYRFRHSYTLRHRE